MYVCNQICFDLSLCRFWLFLPSNQTHPSHLSLPLSPSFNFSLSWWWNLSLVASSTRAVQLREWQLSTVYGWCPVFFFFFSDAVVESIHLVPANGFNLALYYITFVAIQHECPTSRLCTGQDQGGIILGFLYPIATNSEVWVSVCTETHTSELVKMSSWDFLFAWLTFMQNVRCLTKLATDPVSLGTTVYQSTRMTQSLMAGFWHRSPASFCYVIGIQLS